MIRPEKMIDRIVKMPPASTIAAANKPLDAGRAMSITNNIAHLCEQDASQIVLAMGRAYSLLSGNGYATYSGDVARDGSPPSASGVTKIGQQIGWTDRTALRFGPFSLIADEGDSTVRSTVRKVRVYVRFGATGVIDHAGMCAALTRGSSPAEIVEGRALAYAETAVGSSDTEARFDLEPSAVIDATTPADRSIPSAPESYGSAVQTPVRTYYVWVGWSLWDNSPGTFALHSVAAFEYR